MGQERYEAEASVVCFMRLGEKKIERKNTDVASSTIAGPDGISQMAESRTPVTAVLTPIVTE